MNSIYLKCENLSKSFSGSPVFKNLSFTLSNPSSLAVTGRNGSGKSTLLKIIAGLLNADKGSVEISGSENPRFAHISMSAPYINLYDELTGFENIKFFSSLKSVSSVPASAAQSVNEDSINGILEKVGLGKAKHKLLSNYSSGMKQRLKLAFAVINKPPVLLLDEPRTNLDSEGIDILRSLAAAQKQNGILIIATNENEDVKLCDTALNIEEYK